MPKLIMLKGLPASGKSTWANEQVIKSGGNIKRINKDLLREMLDADKWSRGNEKFILAARDVLVQECLRNNISVIVDDTNFAPVHEMRLKQLAQSLGATFETKFFDTPIKDCIERDLKRRKPVGEAVIRKMHKQYLQPKPEVYVPPAGKPTAVIVDIDGTLAHHGERNVYDTSRCEEDTLDLIVARIVDQRYATDQIIVVSGRDEEFKPHTERWLKSNKVRYDALFMRPQGDTRKDDIIKREIYDAFIRDHYDVQFVLDDRPRVIRMWQSLGLKVLACSKDIDDDF